MATDKPISGLASYPSWSASDIIEVVKGGGNYQMPLQTILDNVPTSGGGTGTPGGTNGQVQYNSSGTFAGATLSALIDAGLGNTQGDVLIRGPSGWIVLAPGAAGLSLLSGGAAANPSYGRPDPILWALTGVNTAVANTNTQTTLLNTGTLRGSLTIPAGRLSTAGCRIGLKLYGGITVTGTPTLTFTVKIGGQTLFTGTTAALSAVSAKHWYVSHDNIFVPVVGASGKIAGSAQLVIVNAGSTTLGSTTMTNGGTGGESAPITVNTATALDVDILATWSVADPSNSIRLDYGDMEVHGG